MSESRKWAKQLLSFYFSKAGVNTDKDNQAEIEDIVDNIIEAAVEETLRRMEDERHAD